MYLVYSFLLAVTMLAALPYFAIVGLRHGKYWRSLPQRLGRLPRELVEGSAQRPRAIWIHAVSVGEVMAAAPLARRLKQRFPGRRLLISTTTNTGQQMARERLRFADGIFYFPLDWQVVVRRFFRGIRPALIIVLEVEIWPNLLRVARRQGVPVIFASARVSDRSFRRYRWSGGIIRRALGDASWLSAQSDEDARRLLVLGAPQSLVQVGGNLKFDAPAPGRNDLADWLANAAAQGRRTPVIVAGSIVAGEENAVLDAFAPVRESFPAALLVLAPRKPERFDAARDLALARGWGLVRRSGLDRSQTLDAGVFLLDSIGELGGLYCVADMVYVGGSLVDAGGHNILEPAALGKTPIFGPYMRNFREIAGKFLDCGAAVQVSSSAELARVWLDLLSNDGRREAAGRAARELVEKNAGATDRIMEKVEAILATGRSTR